MYLHVGDVASGEAVPTCTTDPTGELALVEGYPRLLRSLAELLLELGLEDLEPALVTLSSGFSALQSLRAE